MFKVKKFTKIQKNKEKFKNSVFKHDQVGAGHIVDGPGLESIGGC